MDATLLREPLCLGYILCRSPDSTFLRASIDNIRLWNVAEVGEFDRKVKSGVQFKIIAGHHGGFISQMRAYDPYYLLGRCFSPRLLVVDPGARFLITACGNRGWHGESTRTIFVHEIKSTF